MPAVISLYCTYPYEKRRLTQILHELATIPDLPSTMVRRVGVANNSIQHTLCERGTFEISLMNATNMDIECELTNRSRTRPAIPPVLCGHGTWDIQAHVSVLTGKLFLIYLMTTFLSPNLAGALFDEER
jgi:hypothetical protein